MDENKCDHDLEVGKVREEVEEAFYKIKPDFKELPLLRQLKTTNEENRKVYAEMVEILSRPKTEGSCGYCHNCTKKAIEICCTPK